MYIIRVTTVASVFLTLTVWSWKHSWIERVLPHDELLFNLMEGRMVGQPTRGRRRLHTLDDLYDNSGYESEDRSAWRESSRKC